MVSTDRSEGSGHNLKNMKFFLSIGKHFFFLNRRLTKWGNGLLKVVEPAALELFKMQLDTALLTLLHLQNLCEFLWFCNWNKWSMLLAGTCRNMIGFYNAVKWFGLEETFKVHLRAFPL